MNLEIELKYQKAKQSMANQVGCKTIASYHQGVIDVITALKNNTYGPDDPTPNKPAYPQSSEPDEHCYVDPNWLDGIAAIKHPGESWRTIPAGEHAARAMRHLNKYRAGDHEDDHLINASMRIMMAYVVDRTTQNKQTR